MLIGAGGAGPRRVARAAGWRVLLLLPALMAAGDAAAQGVAPAPAATLPLRVRDGLPPFTLELHAEPAAEGGAGVLRLQRIEIRRAADGALLQRIDGIDADVPWIDGVPAVEVLDLDFDGHADLRVVDAAPAGPNVLHRHWLYDARGARFVASPALDALPGLRVDAAARELRSEWRDGPARHGVDVYRFRGGRLVPVRRERREYRAGGVYRLEVSRPAANGGWTVVERREGREGREGRDR